MLVPLDGGEGGAEESVGDGVSIGDEGADDESLIESGRLKDCVFGVVEYKSKMSVTAGETGERVTETVTEDVEAIA